MSNPLKQMRRGLSGAALASSVDFNDVAGCSERRAYGNRRQFGVQTGSVVFLDGTAIVADCQNRNGSIMIAAAWNESLNRF